MNYFLKPFCPLSLFLATHLAEAKRLRMLELCKDFAFIFCFLFRAQCVCMSRMRVCALCLFRTLFSRLIESICELFLYSYFMRMYACVCVCVLCGE